MRKTVYIGNYQHKMDRSDAGSTITEMDIDNDLDRTAGVIPWGIFDNVDVQSEDSGAVCSRVSSEDQNEESFVLPLSYFMVPHIPRQRRHYVGARKLDETDTLHTALLRRFLKRNANKFLDTELQMKGFTSLDDFFERSEFPIPRRYFETDESTSSDKKFRVESPEDCFRICNYLNGTSKVRAYTLGHEYEKILHQYKQVAIPKRQILAVLADVSVIRNTSQLKSDGNIKEEIQWIIKLMQNQDKQPQERVLYFKVVHELDRNFDVLPPRPRIRCCTDGIEYLDCANLSSCRMEKDFREKCCLIFPSVDDLLIKSVVMNREFVDWFLNHVRDVKETSDKTKFHQCTYLLGRMQSCLVSRASGSLIMHYDLQQILLSHLFQISNPVLLWNLLKCDVDLFNKILRMKQHDVELLYLFIRKKLQTMDIVFSKFYLTESFSKDSNIERSIQARDVYYRAGSRIITRMPSMQVPSGSLTFLIILDEVTRSEPTLSRICNIPLSWIWENELNDENEKIFLHQARSGMPFDNLPSVPSKIARKLFECHKNLNAISGSHIVSTGHKVNRHRIIQRKCIVLYCDKKGVIPLKEKSFPKKICGIPTDVREGFFKFASKVQTGDSISSLSSKMGTGGGFVDLDGTVGLLTCAHVLYELHELQNGTLSSGRKVMGLNSNADLGNVRTAVFMTNIPGQVSVDAAVIALNPDVSVDSSFPRAERSQMLAAGFHQIPKNESNSIIKEISEDNRKNQIIKFGTESGLTSGSLRVQGIHIRIRDISLGLEEGESNGQMMWKEEFEMYEQYEVCSNTLSPFFKQGDSGSLVYMVNDPDGTDLRCIGMGIGTSSYGTCIVTPIHKILESLGLPMELKVNACRDSVNEGITQNPSYSKDNSLSLILERLTSIKSDSESTAKVVNNMEEEIKTMKSSLSSMDNRLEIVESVLPSTSSSAQYTKFPVDNQDDTEKNVRKKRKHVHSDDDLDLS